MDDPHFLTTEEAARLLNIHQNTIVRWIKSGRLPSSKSGVNIVSPGKQLTIELTVRPQEPELSPWPIKKVAWPKRPPLSI
jgi:excisionase family DNA binding protein